MSLPLVPIRGSVTKFITNVGLITSNGHFGTDVMACEWTHHISYRPGLIAVCIHPDKATHENIKPVLNCCLFLKYISMKGNVLYLDEVHSISNIVRFWFATTVRNG